MRLCLVSWKKNDVTGAVPENDDESWQNVPCVNRNLNDGTSNLNANWRSNDNSEYSVPVTQ